MFGSESLNGSIHLLNSRNNSSWQSRRDYSKKMSNLILDFNNNNPIREVDQENQPTLMNDDDQGKDTILKKQSRSEEKQKQK